jgi:hypothetical protein
MSACLCLLLAALCGGEPGARWVLTPAEAQIGQPVECRLEIRVPAGSAVLLPEKDPALDPVWVLLEPRRIVRSERGDELALDLSWRLFALEPGTRAPFAFEIPVETAGGRVTLQPAGGELHVLAALGEGEDAPRPQRGFLAPPEGEAPRRWIVWTALGLLLAGALALLLRRKRPAPIVAPGPLERLARLEQGFAAEEARGRQTVFALTHLVRERTDAWLESPRAALPDEEWLRLVADDARLPREAREAAQRLLGRAGEVKYALATPSRFLVEELCADARAVLQAEELAA